jgi:ribonuclease VapC
MIVIDSSAIIAILNDEPERRVFNEAIERADGCLISTASFVEASIVIDNQRGYDGLRDFDLFIVSAGIELVPVDADQAHIARQAFRQYGQRAASRRP